MTRITSDIVDVYVFRRLNARVQFLLLQRRNDVPMARTWQAFHHEIADGQSAPEAARAALATLAGMEIDRFYSADFINQFYDEARDAVVLAPVLAVTARDQAGITLADDFQEAGWFDRDEATARLPFSGQRWALRHIDEIMGIGESEGELYRFNPDASPRPSLTTQPEATIVPDATVPLDQDDIGLEPTAESMDTPRDHNLDDETHIAAPDPGDDQNPHSPTNTEPRQE